MLLGEAPSVEQGPRRRELGFLWAAKRQNKDTGWLNKVAAVKRGERSMGEREFKRRLKIHYFPIASFSQDTPRSQDDKGGPGCYLKVQKHKRTYSSPAALSEC